MQIIEAGLHSNADWELNEGFHLWMKLWSWTWRRPTGVRSISYEPSSRYTTEVGVLPMYLAKSQHLFLGLLASPNAAPCLWSCLWYSQTRSKGAAEAGRVSGSGSTELHFCILQMMAWLHQSMTSDMHLDGLQQIVKQPRWKSAPPSLRPWFSARKPFLGWERVAALWVGVWSHINSFVILRSIFLI